MLPRHLSFPIVHGGFAVGVTGGHGLRDARDYVGDLRHAGCVVEDGFNGLLIPPADARAIQEAVLRLAGSAELRQKLGLAAKQTMTRYTWERSALMLEKLFRRVIAGESRTLE